jgi:hypothetical protein
MKPDFASARALSSIGSGLRVALGSLLLLFSTLAPAQTLYAKDADPFSKLINPEALRALAFALDEHADSKKRALDFLKGMRVQRYNSVKFDPQMLAKEVSKTEAELERLSKPYKSGSVLELQVSATVVGFKDGVASLGSDMSPGMYSVPTPVLSVSSPYLPPSFDILIANKVSFANFKLSEEAQKRLQARLDEGNFAAFMTYEIEFVKLSQHRYLHAAIKRARWFNDWERKDLLSEKREPEKSKKLVEARMLSEGVTLDGVPEHSFDIRGTRMMEVVIEDSLLGQSCKEQQRERGHRVFKCWQPSFDSEGRKEHVEFLVVGGRIVEASFIGAGAPNANHENGMWNMVQREHAGPQIRVEQTLSEWYTGDINFKLDPIAYRKGDSDQPYYVAQSVTYRGLKEGKKGTEVMK